MNRRNQHPHWLTVIDHTADAGVEVTAASAAQLFERAAWAMMDMLVRLDDVKALREQRIAVDGDDWEQLLVHWLTELLFWHEHDHMVFSSFQILDIDATHLRATVHGQPYDPDTHELKTEIKAVTYHQLAVRRRDSRWYARVIFDL